MKSLVVGMGIGELYKAVLTKLNFEVITVDSNSSKNADFNSVEEALAVHQRFDTVNICTPNFTHNKLTQLVAPHSKIVFVEKPGFRNSYEWQHVIDKYPDTRIMMVKNNMWRDNIAEMQLSPRNQIALILSGLERIVFRILAVGLLLKNLHTVELAET